LTSAPYSLSLGATIDVKVIAYNFYGDSQYSITGSGATIVLVPDSPTMLRNLPAITNDMQIGLAWNQGASSNGKQILDYTVAYEKTTDVWVTLATGLTELQYTTIVGLSPGIYYKFRVYARSTVGLSSPG
jgi:hypothetical protein